MKAAYALRGQAKALKCAALALLLVAGGFVSVAQASDIAARERAQIEAFVERIATEAVAAVHRHDSTPEERLAELTLLMRDNGTVTKTARFALGRYARQLNGDERAQYYRLAVQFASKLMSEYLQVVPRIKLDIRRIARKGKGGNQFVVFSKAAVPGTNHVFSVDWWVINTAQPGEPPDFKLFDFSFEGIWLAQSQRSVFVSLLRRNGGNISQLYDFMSSFLRKQSEGAAPNLEELAQRVK